MHVSGDDLRRRYDIELQVLVWTSRNSSSLKLHTFPLRWRVEFTNSKGIDVASMKAFPWEFDMIS